MFEFMTKIVRQHHADRTDPCLGGVTLKLYAENKARREEASSYNIMCNTIQLQRVWWMLGLQKRPE
jgi:hypothetical protein